MSKQSPVNSDSQNSHQANTSDDAQKENNNQLIEMAVEQFASLLLKHSMLKKNSKKQANQGETKNR